MTHDGEALDVADELDRLRLALLHERSRAEHAEQQLADLRAEQARQAEQPAPVADQAAAARPARRGWRR